MIRLAKESDLDEILKIYETARNFMCKNGNPTQWGTTYPDINLITDDIKKHELYVMENRTIYACFVLMSGEDPTYTKIDGSWASDTPYGAIHKVASDGSEKGIVSKAVDFAKKKYSHLRIDTHKNNIPMQKALLKNGFKHRGIIYLEDGSPRLAYDRVEKKCKITVMRKTFYKDLSDKFENPIEHACDIEEGMVFIANGLQKPDNLCDSAWESMLPFVTELSLGGGNFYDGWMKNPHSAMISCNDGFRPVSFLIEALDEIADYI